MPARKKTRVGSRAASTPSVVTPLVEDNSPEEEQEYIPELDPELWTDEQETALFKGMIKWKPVGIHKHLRMIALSQYLRSHGHREQHTRPQGIWKKLGSLYNLKTLDEREDAFSEIGSDDVDTPSDRYCPFKLPEEDFSELMFDRRLEKHKSTSPAAMSSVGEGHASTIDDTEEPRSSPATSSVRGGKASKRGRAAKVVRGRSRLQMEFTPRGRAKPSPEPSADEEEENEDEEDDDEEENEEEDEEEDGKDAPTPKGSRGRGRGRARGGRGGRRGRKRA